MALTDLLGNKMRAFVVGAALTACGGEPETKYVVVGGEEVEANCDGVCDHILACDSGATYGRQECVGNCQEYSLIEDPAWAQCVYDRCDDHTEEACKYLLPSKN